MNKFDERLDFASDRIIFWAYLEKQNGDDGVGRVVGR